MSRGEFFLAVCQRQAVAAKVTAGQVQVDGVSADTDESADLWQLAADALTRLGYCEEMICLGVPSGMVMSARIDSSGIPRKGRRAAMIYRLEEQLPLDAEQLTADFLPPAGGRSFGVAVETARAGEIIDSLAERGVEVASICPTALLALWQARQAAGDGRFVIIPAFDELNVFATDRGRPAAWYTVPADDPSQAVRYVQADLLARPTEDAAAIIIGDAPVGLADALAQEDSLDVATIDDDPMALAAAAASGKLKRGAAGWVDLRRDDLAAPSLWGRAGKLLTTAVILAALLLAALTGLFLRRGQQYAHMARSCQDEQLVEFDGLYPGRTPPPDIGSYLGDELRRLAGISGAGRDVPGRISALNTLRDATAALPEAMRLCVSEMRVGPAGVFIHGRVRTFSDVEAIAGGLTDAGFSVDPPRSERDRDGGVRFFINASLPERPAAAAREDRP